MLKCGECGYLDLKNCRKWNGYCYCKETSSYVDPNSGACAKFKKRIESDSKSSSCYITTMAVSILGLDDNCVVLNTLRNFRNEYLRKTPECIPLLVEYDVFGPDIARALESDPDKVIIAGGLMQNSLIPVCQCIQEKDYDKAISIYKEMVTSLKLKYSIGFNCPEYVYKENSRPDDWGKGYPRLVREKL